MIVKVCGIAFNEDLISVSQMHADYAGFIFADNSPRYAAGKIDPELCALLSRSVPSMKKTGVFVNADADEIKDAIEIYRLDAVQLHGEESVSDCRNLREKVQVIKIFSIEDGNSFERCAEYEGAADLFLFDTAGPLAGGNGFSFAWELLNEYNGSTPFLLSGGIGPADVLKIYEVHHLSFAGIDVNSRFELYPGKKNIEMLKPFVNAFKQSSHELRSL
ncbi:MAG: phosphoribosylanthranilate isomerase [Bacteroidetes bacterium]|nr:phosphoribosylanthranilate isomerase [Bacteroidota bacterium]